MTSQFFHKTVVVLVAALMAVMPGAVHSDSISIYTADFAGGVLPAEITSTGGAITIDPILTTAPGGLSYPFIDATTLGLTGDWVTTNGGNTYSNLRLNLSALPAHTSIDVNVLMGAGGGLDGGSGDRFRVDVGGDASFEFDEGFVGRIQQDAGAYTQNLLAGTGGVGNPGAGAVDYGYRVGGWGHDSIFDLGLDPSLNAISHTANTLTVDFSFRGNNGQGDEQISLSNIEIVLNGVAAAVPEPGSFGMLGLALGLLGLFFWRRRKAA